MECIAGTVRRAVLRLDISHLTPQIALGAAPPAWRLSELRRVGIGAVLDLRTAEERAGGANWDAAMAAVGLRSLWLPVADRSPPATAQLVRSSVWVQEQVGVDRPVLICCRDGTGRTATAAVAALMGIFGYSLPEACAAVHACRDAAEPTEAQLAELYALGAHGETKAPVPD